MSDQMREEFEAAYLAKYDLKPQNWNGVAYLHAHGNGAWWAWQASREALVFELPKLSKVEGCHGVEDVWFPEDIIAAIQSAGVSVK